MDGHRVPSPPVGPLAMSLLTQVPWLGVPRCLDHSFPPAHTYWAPAVYRLRFLRVTFSHSWHLGVPGLRIGLRLSMPVSMDRTLRPCEGLGRTEDTRNSDLKRLLSNSHHCCFMEPCHCQAPQGHRTRSHHGHFNVSLVPVAPSHLPLSRPLLRLGQVKGGSAQARTGDKNQSPQATENGDKEEKPRTTEAPGFMSLIFSWDPYSNQVGFCILYTPPTHTHDLDFKATTGI